MVKIPNGPIWPLYGQNDFGCSLSSVCDPPSDHRTHTTPPPLSACNETAQVIAVTTFCDQVHGFMRLVCGAIEECQKNGKHKTAHWTDLQPGDLRNLITELWFPTDNLWPSYIHSKSSFRTWYNLVKTICVGKQSYADVGEERSKLVLETMTEVCESVPDQLRMCEALTSAYGPPPKGPNTPEDLQPIAIFNKSNLQYWYKEIRGLTVSPFLRSLRLMSKIDLFFVCLFRSRRTPSPFAVWVTWSCIGSSGTADL